MSLWGKLFGEDDGGKLPQWYTDAAKYQVNRAQQASQMPPPLWAGASMAKPTPQMNAGWDQADQWNRAAGLATGLPQGMTPSMQFAQQMGPYEVPGGYSHQKIFDQGMAATSGAYPGIFDALYEMYPALAPEGYQAGLAGGGGQGAGGGGSAVPGASGGPLFGEGDGPGSPAGDPAYGGDFNAEQSAAIGDIATGLSNGTISISDEDIAQFSAAIGIDVDAKSLAAIALGLATNPAATVAGIVGKFGMNVLSEIFGLFNGIYSGSTDYGYNDVMDAPYGEDVETDQNNYGGSFFGGPNASTANAAAQADAQAAENDAQYSGGGVGSPGAAGTGDTSAGQGTGPDGGVGY